jgi:hypothetical protein
VPVPLVLSNVHAPPDLSALGSEDSICELVGAVHVSSTAAQQTLQDHPQLLDGRRVIYWQYPLDHEARSIMNTLKGGDIILIEPGTYDVAKLSSQNRSQKICKEHCEHLELKA